VQKIDRLKLNAVFQLYLGDDFIIFENFTASVGDLMVAN